VNVTLVEVQTKWQRLKNIIKMVAAISADIWQMGLTECGNGTGRDGSKSIFGSKDLSNPSQRSWARGIHKSQLPTANWLHRTFSQRLVAYFWTRNAKTKYIPSHQLTNFFDFLFCHGAYKAKGKDRPHSRAKENKIKSNEIDQTNCIPMDGISIG